MTPEQALQIVDSLLATMMLNRAQQAQAINALKVLGELVERAKSVSRVLPPEGEAS